MNKRRSSFLKITQQAVNTHAHIAEVEEPSIMKKTVQPQPQEKVEVTTVTQRRSAQNV